MAQIALAGTTCLGEGDYGRINAVDVPGPRWAPVRGITNSVRCGVYGFNSGRRGGGWGGCGCGGRTYRGGSGGNACFKCGETGHMARDCYQGGGSAGGRYAHKGFLCYT